MALLALIALATGIPAAPKDDILSLTNGVRAKVIWVRSDASQSLDNLYNRGTNSIIVGIDTDEGTVRTVDATRGNHSFPLISRRGEYVAWNNDPAGSADAFGGSSPNTASWVCKWDGTGRQKLIDGAAGDPGYIFCFMLDDRTDQEWVYTGRLGTNNSANNSTVIYRYPFTAGTVDKAKRETVYTASGNPIPVVASGQGKYLGGNFAWPNAHRVIVASGQKTQLNATDDWSCWAQAAPDLSGRAMHMKADHANMLMYQLTTAQGGGTLINLNRNIPGNRGKYDCPGFRWSNNPRFLASSYPLGIDVTPLGTPKFCIGRFNDTYTAIDQWVTLPDTTTTTYNDQIGDFWLVNGQGLPGSSVRESRSGLTQASRVSVYRVGNQVRVSVPEGTQEMQVVNTLGRLLVSRRLSVLQRDVALTLPEKGICFISLIAVDGTVEPISFLVR